MPDEEGEADRKQRRGTPSQHREDAGLESQAGEPPSGRDASAREHHLGSQRYQADRPDDEPRRQHGPAGGFEGLLAWMGE